ncbi:RDD family protein [Microbacterium aurugineum]
MTQPALDQIAPLSRRAVAYVIDALIAGGLAIVLGGGLLVAASLTGSVEGMVGVLLVGGPVVSLVLLGWFVVYTVMQAGAGSIGMRAQGVRLVAAADGGPLGFGRALLRNVIFGLAAAVVVGYFTPLFDGSGRFQGWHDKVAGSLILDARKTGPVGSASEATSSSSASAPGLATPTTGPAIPGLPQSVPAAPTPAAPAPAAPAPPAPASSSLPPRPAAPPAPVAESGSLIAFVPGITQDAPSRSEPPAQPEPELDATVQQHPGAPVTPPAPPAPVAAPAVAAPPVPPLPAAPVPAAPEAVEQDDDLEETRISVPGHRLVFTWDDGTRVSVSRRTIFGRNPAPEEGATLVPVRDETLSLSKTHFEAAAETSGGWVRDRHSTNGMTIVRDGQRIACPAGQRVPVRLGDAIEIGDRIVTIGGYA